MKQLELIKKRRRTPGVKWGRPVSTNIGARQKRETFLSRHPLHITLRLREGLPNLRTQRGAKIVRNAIAGMQRNGVRVVHFALLSNHIHMIVEPKNASAFFGSMKSFTSRLAIHFRRWGPKDVIKKLDARGLGLFVGRYDIQILKTPQQMKNALKYVLLNPAKHFKKAPYIDFFTSGALFSEWENLIGKTRTELSNGRNAILHLQDRLQTFLSPPELWLTQMGWKKAI